MTTRPSLPGLLLLLVLSLPASGAPLAFRLTTDPAQPVAGQPFAVELLVKDLSGLSLGATSLGPGLELRGSLVKPYVSADGQLKGSLLRLDLDLSGPGPWTINRLEVSGAEGRLSLGPFRFEAAAPSGPSSTGGAKASPRPWSWVGPDQAFRYGCFALSLEPAEPGGAPVAGATSSFVPPPGANFEALPGQGLRWTVTALEAGSLLLPEVKVEAANRGGRAARRRIEILPLPAGIVTSRAMGDFALSLEPPPQALLREGDGLLFRLIVEGRGNLPSVIIPEPVLSLEGRRIGKESLTLRRLDEVVAVEGGYQGRIILEVSLAAPGQGTLTVEVPPLPVLRPDGSLVPLSVDAYRARIIKAESQRGGRGDPFRAAAPLLAKGLAAVQPSLARLPSLVAASRYAQARALLDQASPRLGGRAEARALDACLLWLSGSRGEALAQVYRANREPGAGSALTGLAASAAAYLGTPRPAAKALPRSATLLALALGLGFLGLGLGLASLPLRRGRARAVAGPAGRARAGPYLLRGFAILCLLAGLGSGFLAAASALEDGVSYGVVWTDTLTTVPSPLAEGRVIVVKGSPARVLGTTEGYVGLRLEDGSAGWAPADLVFLF